jgi:hypothetical protein
MPLQAPRFQRNGAVAFSDDNWGEAVMPDPTRRVFGLALAASLAACATGRVAPLEQDRDLITGAELAHTNDASVYEAIRHLRPLFLHTRGPSSVLNSTAMGPAVIVDQTFLGGIRELTDIPLKDVQAVRYLPAWDATTRYGSGYANGVIEVTTWTGNRRVGPN